MIYEAALFTLLQQQPACYVEIPDNTRDTRLTMVAHELARLPQSVAVALAYQGWQESKWSSWVWNGCIPSKKPKGASGNCDRGRARGAFQLWENTCRAAYQYEPGTAESLHEEVACAARIWRNGIRRCEGRHPDGNIAGAFSAFAGASCEWPGGAARAREYEATLQRFLRIRRQP